MQHWLSRHRRTRPILSTLSHNFRSSGLSTPVFLRYASVTSKIATEVGEKQPRYDFIEDAEPPGRYLPGGYHPIYIGDVLNHRYHVVHKLGFGSYSTTWLARDMIRNDSYTALKIKTADSSLSSKETRTWRQLSAGAGSEGQSDIASPYTSKEYIPPLLDEFTFDGPNGTHECIVTTPARMSVAEAQDATHTRLFQPRVARAIAAQLIQAVAFMHARGYVHGGELIFIPSRGPTGELIEDRFTPWQCSSKTASEHQRTAPGSALPRLW